MGRNLRWMACRHHMFEILLSDVFCVCFGQSSGPEILLFKRFREIREKWQDLLQRQPKPRATAATPLIAACEQLKEFIVEQIQVNHPLSRIPSTCGIHGRFDH